MVACASFSTEASKNIRVFSADIGKMETSMAYHTSMISEMMPSRKINNNYQLNVHVKIVVR